MVTGMNLMNGGNQIIIQFKDTMLLTLIQCLDQSSSNLVWMKDLGVGTALSSGTKEQAP